MNLPDILNVAIGLVVLYFLLSTIGSTLITMFVRALRYREEILCVTINKMLTGSTDRPWNSAKLLWARVAEEIIYIMPAISRELLAKILVPNKGTITLTGVEAEDALNKAIVAKYWEHVKMKSLSSKHGDAPPSLNPDVFSSILIDIVIPKDSRGELPLTRVDLERRLTSIEKTIPESLFKSLKDLLLSGNIARDAEGDALWGPFADNIEQWFESSMDRAKEFFKGFTQKWLLALGFALALILNADTIRIAYFLSIDKEARDSVAVYAADIVNETPAEVDKSEAEKKVVKDSLASLRDLSRMGFPVGWTGNVAFDYLPYSSAGKERDVIQVRFLDVLFKFLGLALTAFAINLGAPFWHDVLGKLIQAKQKLSKGGAAASPRLPDTASAAAGNVTQSGTAMSISKGRVQLEVGRDLAEPCSGFDARKAYWLARCSDLAYSAEETVKRVVSKDWFMGDAQWFTDPNDQVDTQAFAFANNEVAVVSFRGTEPSVFNDILTDAKVRRTKLPEKKGMQFHKGFTDALDVVSEKLIEWIREHADGSKTLYLTGHSLGGALATLLASRLAETKLPVVTKLQLYTYGCPMVGNDVYAKAFGQSYDARAFRLVHGNDVVPMVPPPSLGYCHVGEAVQFLKPAGIARQVSSVERLLGLSIDLVDDLKDASRSAIGDHGMENYVTRCHSLAVEGKV